MKRHFEHDAVDNDSNYRIRTMENLVPKLLATVALCAVGALCLSGPARSDQFAPVDGCWVFASEEGFSKQAVLAHDHTTMCFAADGGVTVTESRAVARGPVLVAGVGYVDTYALNENVPKPGSRKETLGLAPNVGSHSIQSCKFALSDSAEAMRLTGCSLAGIWFKK